MSVIGRVHSFQSLGTLDGPGVRFVVFMQGCNLRCKCCHNPDTWDLSKGTEYTPEQILERVVRFRAYLGEKGGITLSGGEPLLQAEFAREVFALCKERGINTCLDTSGSILNDEVKKLLDVTDCVLLDIKYTSGLLYEQNVGCTMGSILEFLAYLNGNNIPTTLRQVIIPTVNDSIENISALKEVARQHKCVDKIEFLPFRKICQTKYDKLGITFPFGDLPEPTQAAMQELKKLL